MAKTLADTSLQAQCRGAMNKLAESGAIFTEIDVLNRASQGRGWTNKIFREAADRAYIVLQTAYRQGLLVRFGPVEYKQNRDYARKATKIVYAQRDNGPEVWETPNGVFPRLLSEDDEMSAPGRRPNEIVNRDDSQPWDLQKVHVRERDKQNGWSRNGNGHGPPVDHRPFEKRIQELEAELKRYQAHSPSPSELNPEELAERVVDLLAERLVG